MLRKKTRHARVWALALVCLGVSLAVCAAEVAPPKVDFVGKTSRQELSVDPQLLQAIGQPDVRALRSQILYMQAEDIAEILLRFEKGVIAEVHLDLFQRVKRRQSLFMGTEGTVIIDLADWSRCSIHIYRAATGRWECETVAMELEDLFQAEDRAFLRCVATREKPALDGWEGKKSLQTALGAVTSSEQGRMIQF